MRANGFTLVELMVVVALMAVTAGAVVLTVGSAGEGAAGSATRFASRLAAARDEAILTGRPVRAWVSPSGYGFDRYRHGQWEPMTEKPFAAADWDSDTKLALDGDARSAIRLRFDALGMPDGNHSLRLSGGGQTAEVRIAANGDVTVD